MVLLARPGQAPRPKAAPARWLESGRAGQRAPRGKPVTSRSAGGGGGRGLVVPDLGFGSDLLHCCHPNHSNSCKHAG